MNKSRIFEILQDYVDLIISIENIRSSFDAIIKRKKKRYFVKILNNIDSLQKEESKSLAKAASFFSAQPFIIGNNSNNGMIEDYILFKRFSIFAGTLNTFIEYINNKPLPVKNAQEYYRIDGKKMRRLRETMKLSLQELSYKLGISKETLYRYEKGSIFAGVENLKKLEKFFSSKLSKIQEYEKKVELKEIGDFKGVEIKNPFYYLLKDSEEKFIVGMEKSTTSIMEKYMLIYKKISDETGSKYFFITKHRIDAPYILKEEFKSIGFSNKIKRMIKKG